MSKRSEQAKKKAAQRRAQKKSASSGANFDDLSELREARTLWANNRLLESLALFDQCVEAHPNHVLALVDASRANGSMYRHQRAELLLERLLELGVSNSGVMHLAGQSYRILRRWNRALTCFQEAVKIGNAPIDALLELALIEERHGELDSALQHLRVRKQALPQDPEGDMLSGRILRRLGRYEEAVEQLKSVASQKLANWLTRRRAYCELAQLYDEQENSVESWAAIGAGQQTAIPHSTAARQHRDRLVPPLLRLTEQVRAEQLPNWMSENEPRKPAIALLTGMPRSGTTLLGSVLSAHSDIGLGDEFDAFPRLVLPALVAGRPPEAITVELLDQLPPDHIAVQTRTYRSFMSSAIGIEPAPSLLLDKNPSLLPLLTPYLRTNPTGKIIVVLRDPRDILMSCLMTYFPLNDFSVDFLELDSAVRRLELDVQTWLQFRNKGTANWIEIKYEAFLADLPGQARSLIDFLDLPWQPKVLDYLDSPADPLLNSPSYASVQKPLYHRAIGRWRRFQPQLSEYLPRLEKLATTLGYS